MNVELSSSDAGVLEHTATILLELPCFDLLQVQNDGDKCKSEKYKRGTDNSCPDEDENGCLGWKAIKDTEIDAHNVNEQL